MSSYSPVASQNTTTDSILRLLDAVYGGAVNDIMEGNNLLESLLEKNE
jgi:hypothetical protein